MRRATNASPSLKYAPVTRVTVWAGRTHSAMDVDEVGDLILYAFGFPLLRGTIGKERGMLFLLLLVTFCKDDAGAC